MNSIDTTATGASTARYDEVVPKATPVAGQLTRDLEQSMLGGVCAGVAEAYDFDVTLVRVVTVLLGVATGGLIVPLYLVAWVVMPKRESSGSPSTSSATGTSEGMRPSQETKERVSREMREVGGRLGEVAIVLAAKAREAAEEIAQIARRPRPKPTGTDTPASSAPADTSATNDMPEGRSEPEISPAMLPPAISEQAPTAPPPPPFPPPPSS